MTRRTSHIAFTAFLALSLTACGSTVQRTRDAAGPSSLGGGSTGSGSGTDSTGTSSTSGTNSSGGSLGSTSGTSASGTGTAGTGSGTGTGAGTTGGSSTGGAGTSGGSTGTSGAGTSTSGSGGGFVGKKEPVEIGVYEIKDLSSVKAGGASLGNTEKMDQAVIDYLNAHGGMAGHKITPIYDGAAFSDSRPYSSQLSAACQNWTQDHHVAAITYYDNNDTLVQDCGNKAKASVVMANLWMHDKQDFAKWPYMVDPIQPNLDTLYRAYVDGLFAQGFFKPSDKIGLLTVDTPEATRARTKTLIPALAAHGLKLYDTFQVRQPNSTDEAANSVQDIQAAELRFSSDGVNKVLDLCAHCIGFFMTDAQKQGYHPTYGLTTADLLYGISGDDDSYVPQLKGAKAIGWQPHTDQLEGDVKLNATAKLCLKLITPTGQADTQANRNIALQQCDMFLALAKAAAAADPVARLTGDTFQQGFARLAGSYESPLTTSATFTSSKHDGPSTYAPMSYVDACNCFRYTGKPRAFPS